jgi:hypothetical protein
LLRLRAVRALEDTRMRRLVPALFATAAFLVAARADAAGLCDPQGHLCLQLDTTSARVCTPLAPGGPGSAHCEPEDAETRDVARQIETMTHGTMKAVGLSVVRFDDWYTIVTLVRRAPEPEVGGDGGAREAMAIFARYFASSRPAGWKVEETQAPSLERVHDVQVARLEQRESGTGARGNVWATRTVAFDVRTRDAAYVVTFDASDADASRLERFADAAMATLDGLPVESAGNASDAIAWLVRGGVAALVLVGLGYLWGRRKGARRGIASRDLWPH